ncbi:MAG: serine hydrolase domain-containing protein [Thermomicrobiaceae bacterium]
MGSDTSELKNVVEQLLADWQVPGVAVGIFHNGEVQTHGFGVASLETGFPMRPDTVLQIGSISKIFTSTLVMTLVDEGKIDLDTPLIEYMPDLQLQDKDARQALTMRHLLTHTSGLYGDWFEDFGLGDDSLSNAIANVHSLRQIAPPGEVWSYCNSGFYIAGAIIERLTDQTFEQAMQERVFDPIGMEKATFFAHEAIVYPTAVGHNLEEGEQVVARRYPLPRNVNAAGGIITDVGEMLRFAQMHLNQGTIDGNQVLTPESIAAMQNEETKAAVMADYYGLAWALRDRDGKRLVGHGGSTNGFRAYLSTVPEEQFAIVMLTNGNLGTAVYNRLEDWALEHYCGIKTRKPEQVALSNEQLEHLSGNYEQPIHKIAITVRDGGLQLDVVDRSPLVDESKEVKQDPKWAYPTSDRDFIIQGGPDDGQHVDFIFDDAGNPKYFHYHGRVSEPVK